MSPTRLAPPFPPGCVALLALTTAYGASSSPASSADTSGAIASYEVEARITFTSSWPAGSDFAESLFPTESAFTLTVDRSHPADPRLIVGGWGRGADVRLRVGADGLLVHETAPGGGDERRTSLTIPLNPPVDSNCSARRRRVQRQPLRADHARNHGAGAVRPAPRCSRCVRTLQTP